MVTYIYSATETNTIQYSITHNNYSTKTSNITKNYYYSYLKRKRRRALRNSFVWDILSIDTGIEFHKNGVFYEERISVWING